MELYEIIIFISPGLLIVGIVCLLTQEKKLKKHE